jgi:hypothetical protein
MKLNVKTTATLVALGVAALAGCNTIKGLMGGDEEAPKTEAEPSAETTATAAPTPVATETAAPEITASAAPTAEPITAANEADIKRFDDEQKRDVPAETKIKDKATTVIKEPPSGAVVALLQPATLVKVVAERDGFTLLAFQNPSKPEETLLGWAKTDTVEPVAAAAVPPTPSEPCVPGFSKVFVGTTERCEVVCTSNAGCPTGKICSGGAKASNGGVPGDAVKFCATPSAAPAPTSTSPRRPRTDPEPPKEETKKKRKGKKKADE